MRALLTVGSAQQILERQGGHGLMSRRAMHEHWDLQLADDENGWGW
jgi:hypothetical protein